MRQVVPCASGRENAHSTDKPHTTYSACIFTLLQAFSQQIHTFFFGLCCGVDTGICQTALFNMLDRCTNPDCLISAYFDPSHKLCSRCEPFTTCAQCHKDYADSNDDSTYALCVYAALLSLRILQMSALNAFNATPTSALISTAGTLAAHLVGRRTPPPSRRRVQINNIIWCSEFGAGWLLHIIIISANLWSQFIYVSLF